MSTEHTSSSSSDSSSRRSRESGDSGNFIDFVLAPVVARGIADAGFVTPRPIQAQTIPAALEGRDVLGLAQTGTGKTAAFALPILDRLVAARGRGTRALVLAPTRELAMQIDAEIRMLARHTRISTVTVYGGVNANSQIRALRKNPDVIVACPGRLLDLYQQGHVKLSGIEVVVLDEADHMFDSGFLPDIQRILKTLPRERQNLMFSATMPDPIRKLADRILDRPHVAKIAHARPAGTIEHAFYPVAATRKTDLLHHVLNEDEFSSGIVFARTKHRAKRLAQQLSRKGHRAIALQGDMSQPQRDRAMQGFREGRFNILVATDIAARGIDVDNLSHVINYDVPNTPEAYTHRVGRTGRSERTGKAYTFVSKDDQAQVRDIERYSKLRIPRREVDGYATDKDALAAGGSQGDRPQRPGKRERTRRKRRTSGGTSSRRVATT